MGLKRGFLTVIFCSLCLYHRVLIMKLKVVLVFFKEVRGGSVGGENFTSVLYV